MVDLEDDYEEGSTILQVPLGQEEYVTLYEAEEVHGPNHNRRAWGMDEEEPPFVVELKEAESTKAREFPNVNGDMDAAHGTASL
jgi:hypothetical protein